MDEYDSDYKGESWESAVNISEARIANDRAEREGVFFLGRGVLAAVRRFGLECRGIEIKDEERYSRTLSGAGCSHGPHTSHEVGGRKVK